MKVRVLYNDDGSVGVITPVYRNKKKDESEGNFLKRVFDKATPKGLEFDDIDNSELPDRKDRDMWIGSKGNKISIKKSI